jgi:hypothetical protein
VLKIERIEQNLKNGLCLTKSEFWHIQELIDDCKNYTKVNDCLNYYKKLLKMGYENINKRKGKKKCILKIV